MNSANKPNTFYVTTSIPYVNSTPHLGHAMEFVQADVLARWRRACGDDTFFLTGTDEHGQKNWQTAEKNGMEVAEFTARNTESFRTLTQLLHISNNYFVRTTDDRHKAAAQKIWNECSHDIYKDTYSGSYCVGCERFYPEKEIVDGKCPIHETELEYSEMESYFFRLSKYTDQIRSLIADDKLRVLPAKRKNEMLAFVDGGLEDVSISRPKSQLPWGVEVPSDSSHVMYVWFDALTNYISAIGYEDNSEQFAQWWPAQVHVVGKDIARFHCLLWPAMLLSAGLDTPRSVYVHGFINAVGGTKMSKSLGNVVDPDEIIATYGVDALRYYLLRAIPSDNDGEFGLERLGLVYNADLANGLGNLVQRVASMTVKYCDGAFAVAQAEKIDISKQLNDCRFDRALEQIFTHITIQNQRIEENKPWELAKNDSAAVAELLASLIAHIKTIGEALTPFLPETAEKIDAIFKDGKVDTSVGMLFPRID